MAKIKNQILDNKNKEKSEIPIEEEEKVKETNQPTISQMFSRKTENIKVTEALTDEVHITKNKISEGK